MKLLYGQATHPGRERANNEDAVLLRVHPSAPAFALAAVADGLGGLSHGDLASVAAISELQRQFLALTDPGVSSTWLPEAFTHAHEAVRKVASGRRRLGTTLVAAVVCRRQVYFANVGDSRGYVASPDSIEQITQDHTVAAEQKLKGAADSAASSGAFAEAVTRSLGTQESSPRVDVFGPLPLSVNDRILLCSDGLYSLVSDREIQETAVDRDPESASESLIALANERGGFDNISVVVLGFACLA